jgi:signal transduction histidine kinase
LVQRNRDIAMHNKYQLYQSFFDRNLGSIATVTSEPGKGSVFTVRLPGGASS